MDLVSITSDLNRNKSVIISLLEDLDLEAAKWRPAENSWSLLEIICHLYDEEREDFRKRLKHILENPFSPMESIDPAFWVADRKYMSQDFYERLLLWKMEREKSVSWLQGLKNPDFKLSHPHPKLGPISGELMLANWLAHDYLHIRQIVRVKYRYLAVSSNKNLDYAGSW